MSSTDPLSNKFRPISFLSEELADKKKRDALWKIYLDKTDINKDQLKQNTYNKDMIS